MWAFENLFRTSSGYDNGFRGFFGDRRQTIRVEILENWVRFGSDIQFVEFFS